MEEVITQLEDIDLGEEILITLESVLEYKYLWKWRDCSAWWSLWKQRLGRFHRIIRFGASDESPRTFVCWWDNVN